MSMRKQCEDRGSFRDTLIEGNGNSTLIILDRSPGRRIDLVGLGIEPIRELEIIVSAPRDGSGDAQVLGRALVVAARGATPPRSTTLSLLAAPQDTPPPDSRAPWGSREQEQEPSESVLAAPSKSAVTLTCKDLNRFAA
jgi:hypothetical protein